ncbi:hypothetical protein FA95DRAFT_694168 [Auriscalpium vulgare]|uniref:Uncharacterized protein n=1 Tax=Auriscalpium vulgare TaxID=40419 RepID=A0ACB8RBK1_9AGAM|nr:hypothetical protein FA95DRAFT_694168 [Auriscalpium vulgare]
MNNMPEFVLAARNVSIARLCCPKQFRRTASSARANSLSGFRQALSASAAAPRAMPGTPRSAAASSYSRGERILAGHGHRACQSCLEHCSVLSWPDRTASPAHLRPMPPARWYSTTECVASCTPDWTESTECSRSMCAGRFVRGHITILS